MESKRKYLSIMVVLLFYVPGMALGGVIRIDESAFTADAGLITFSEFSFGTVNPTYMPADYGGDPSTAPTVMFDGFFAGQMLGGGACGGATTGCVVGTPTGPLSLHPAAPDTFITSDGASPTSPVLSGLPIFNGPIAILFSVDIAGVGLDGGYFDALGGTAITAYARDGSMLGQVTNEAFGIEFLGLVTDDGTDQIAGLLFSLVGDEPAGFGIDQLQFGRQGQVLPPGPIHPIPEPGTLLLFGVALAALGLRRLRNRE